MRPTEQEQRVLAKVLQMLGSGQALAQDIEDYIVGYAVLGTLVASAQGEAETAEMQTKVAWAEAFAAAKLEGGSDALARTKSDVATQNEKRAEIRARERLTKLKGTRDAVQEAIWGIKYLGKNGG